MGICANLGCSKGKGGLVKAFQDYLARFELNTQYRAAVGTVKMIAHEHHATNAR